MVVTGVHIRVASGRYLAGLAVVEDRDLVRARSLPAPADADVGRQLEELHELAGDLLAEFAPTELAVKVSEARGRSLAVALRAEGCALAAAGHHGVPARLWFGAGLTRPSGLSSRSSVQERVNALCGELSEMPAQAEVAQAAAAALASIKARGG
jgi:hypothetical protein